MKFHTKIAIALITASASVFSFGSMASAGEGAAAGAVSATLDASGNVTSMAAAGAVGKNDAGAFATTNNGINTATALGSAGVIELLSDAGSFTDATSTETFSNNTLKGSADTALGTNQANSISTFSETPIGSVETGFSN
ncbi:MAG: hypothetical protein ACSI46_10435 [Gloeotrichia echinulata DVL01]|jgi:hypothetical protein